MTTRKENGPRMLSIIEAEHEAGIVAGETGEELGHAGFLRQA